MKDLKILAIVIVLLIIIKGLITYYQAEQKYSGTIIKSNNVEQVDPTL